MVNDSFPGLPLFYIWQNFSRFHGYMWICHLDLSILISASCDGCHA